MECKLTDRQTNYLVEYTSKKIVIPCIQLFIIIYCWVGIETDAFVWDTSLCLQYETTVFNSVKKSIPCLPQKWLVPKKLPRVPENENIESGTGIGTFTPTWPTSISEANFLAVAPFVVKIAVPLPYGLVLIMLMASSRVSTNKQMRTGPKISSL